MAILPAGPNTLSSPNHTEEKKEVRTGLQSIIHNIAQKLFALLGKAYEALQILLIKINVRLPASEKVTAMLAPIFSFFSFNATPPVVIPIAEDKKELDGGSLRSEHQQETETSVTVENIEFTVLAEKPNDEAKKEDTVLNPASSKRCKAIFEKYSGNIAALNEALSKRGADTAKVPSAIRPTPPTIQVNETYTSETISEQTINVQEESSVVKDPEPLAKLSNTKESDDSLKINSISFILVKDEKTASDTAFLLQQKSERLDNTALRDRPSPRKEVNVNPKVGKKVNVNSKDGRRGRDFFNKANELHQEHAKLFPVEVVEVQSEVPSEENSPVRINTTNESDNFGQSETQKNNTITRTAEVQSSSQASVENPETDKPQSKEAFKNTLKKMIKPTVFAAMKK